MVQVQTVLTADDVAAFRAAERVVLTEGAGIQKVICHTRSGRRPGDHGGIHEITVHRFASPRAGRDVRPVRSLILNRPQVAAWRHLCSRLRTGDRLTLAWDDRKRPGRRPAVTVLVARGARLHRYQLTAAGGRRAIGTIGLRPGRLALVLAAAAGLWWLARHLPALAVVVAVLLLLGMVVHRRRARDGWPLGTVRMLRLLAFVAITAMPLVLGLLIVLGVVYGSVRVARWARGAWRGATGWGATMPVRSWRVDQPRRGAVLDMEPDGDGVHRRPAPTGKAAPNANVVPMVAVDSAEAYGRHIDMAAAVLDLIAPGWEQLVDAELLARAADPGGLVLESAFGSRDAGVASVVGYLDSERRPNDLPEEQRWADAVERCVRAALGSACDHIGNGPYSVHQRALRTAWCDELARRTRDHAPAS